jgi:membrane-bound lytic murein transglycosylase D
VAILVSRRSRLSSRAPGLGAALCAGAVSFAEFCAPLHAFAEPFALTWAQEAAEGVGIGLESPELRTMRLAEEELFGAGPEAAPDDFDPDCVYGAPDGLVAQPKAPPQLSIQGKRVDLGFLRDLKLPPGLPVRWDRRVIEYLVFFRDDRRGRELAAAWLKRVERYAPMVRRVLAEHSLPDDLLFVAMIESGFDPTARSAADARGMWQFVKQAGESYALRIDRWTDERLDPERSTRAASRYMRDLYDRFGSWDLAFAAYNMGYAALLRAMRKYNTNDYWMLSHLEAGLPFETTLYVAKITAMAVVAHNPERFGFKKLTPDAPVSLAKVDVPEGTQLKTIAAASGVDVDTLRGLNPHILKDRVPPGEPRVALYVPKASYDKFAQKWSKGHDAQLVSHVLRFGESLEDVARRAGVSAAKLRELNQLEPDEAARAGLPIFVPASRAASEPRVQAEPLVAAVPDRTFRYKDRRRVFYRVGSGDTLASIARFFDVTVDELGAWNSVVDASSLPRDLLLQLFVRPDLDLSRALVFTPDEVRVLVVGSEEFFEFHESQRGRVRVRYRVQPGDTTQKLGQKFELSAGSIGRINQFAPQRDLKADEWIILYVPEAALAELEKKKLAVRTGSSLRVAESAGRLAEAAAKVEAPETEDIADDAASDLPLRVRAPRPADILGREEVP